MRGEPPNEELERVEVSPGCQAGKHLSVRKRLPAAHPIVFTSQSEDEVRIFVSTAEAIVPKFVFLYKKET